MIQGISRADRYAAMVMIREMIKMIRGTALGKAIKTAVDALPEADRRDRGKVLHAIGAAVIDHVAQRGARWSRKRKSRGKRR